MTGLTKIRFVPIELTYALRGKEYFPKRDQKVKRNNQRMTHAKLKRKEESGLKPFDAQEAYERLTDQWLGEGAITHGSDADKRCKAKAQAKAKPKTVGAYVRSSRSLDIEIPSNPFQTRYKKSSDRVDHKPNR